MPDLLKQELWGQDITINVLTSPPGESDAHSSLRATAI